MVRPAKLSPDPSSLSVDPTLLQPGSLVIMARLKASTALGGVDPQEDDCDPEALNGHNPPC
ncbi:hypothetical protein N7451_001548 [Penicillium sp. IBT 35674x]|nr:hypothetical protein N7451_001548 [Penicillium sp. IBT 35674x]